VRRQSIVVDAGVGESRNSDDLDHGCDHNEFRHDLVDSFRVGRFGSLGCIGYVRCRDVREWLEANTPNVHPVGRNGMHRYNNQDHSMFTAMLSVENIFGAHHDVWDVNVDEEYHEEKVAAPPHPNQ
jgi:hypothetical protein